MRPLKNRLPLLDRIGLSGSSDRSAGDGVGSSSSKQVATKAPTEARAYDG
jgi:hypothetical protein